MKRGFVQGLGWTLVVIWIAVGFLLFFIGGLFAFFLGIFWVIIFLYVQIGVFGKFSYDDSDDLIVSNEFKGLVKVWFWIIIVGIVLFSLAAYLDG